MKNTLYILILFITIIACDPCDDCDVVSFEPTVSFVFINQDSIAKIDDSLAIIVMIDSSFNANIDSLNILRDSLALVEEAIAGGSDLSAEKMNLEQWILDRQADSAFYAPLDEDGDSITLVLNTTKSTINSGRLYVEQIDILGANSILSFEDSAEVWSVPLAFDGTFSEYEVTINGITETIELAYDNFQEIDDQRNVLIRAENIRVVNEPYDSLINCEENCLDGETTFTFYF